MAGNNLNTGLVKFCQFFLKILSVNKNLASIKGHNSVKNLRKITGNNNNLDLVNASAYTKFDEILSICSKILRGTEILPSIKGHNSVTNLQKMTSNDPNLDLVNINAYTNFGNILSICSRDIERKRKSDIY